MALVPSERSFPPTCLDTRWGYVASKGEMHGDFAHYVRAFEQVSAGQWPVAADMKLNQKRSAFQKKIPPLPTPRSLSVIIPR